MTFDNQKFLGGDRVRSESAPFQMNRYFAIANPDMDAFSGEVTGTSAVCDSEGGGSVFQCDFDTTTGPTEYLPGTDHRGNVTMLVSESTGAMEAEFDGGRQPGDGRASLARRASASGCPLGARRWQYDPYGQTLRKEGAYDKIPFRYQTKWDIDFSGLIDYGLRWYQPINGRFINRDPIGEAGGNNLYEAFGGDPVNRWDVLGLDDEDDPVEGPDLPDFTVIGCPDREYVLPIGGGCSYRVVEYRQKGLYGCYVAYRAVTKTCDGSFSSGGIDRPPGSSSGGSGSSPLSPPDGTPNDPPPDGNACGKSGWQRFKNWLAGIGGDQAPLRRINSWFDGNPKNTYANPVQLELLNGPTLLGSDTTPPWSAITFREPPLRQGRRGFQYSVWNGSGFPNEGGPHPSMDGTYARSPSQPRGIQGGASAIDLANSIGSGQGQSSQTLSKFLFLYSNYNDGFWYVKDFSSGAPGTYLGEGQAREILQDIFEWYGREISPNFEENEGSEVEECK